MNTKIKWPDGKDFAFTVFDDTDFATLENVKPVYSLLADSGLRTTKSVWPLQGQEPARIEGATCEDQKYLIWLYELQKSGFEIGYHNATYHSCLRTQTIDAIESFKKLFGYYPKSMANHYGNQENIYWGECRLSGLTRFIYNALLRNRRRGEFRGHMEGDGFFWGDVCKEKIQYVRNFVYADINTLKACPAMPYHDPQRPYVNYWFASSEGAKVDSFNNCISEKNQDRLEEEGGACIMYTHFACGFYDNGNLDSRFKFLIQRLGRKNGWFVPVATLLDYLKKVNGSHEITDSERSRLERNWFLHKIKLGGTT